VPSRKTRGSGRVTTEGSFVISGRAGVSAARAKGVQAMEARKVLRFNMIKSFEMYVEVN
jgi:hypothetical protein